VSNPQPTSRRAIVHRYLRLFVHLLKDKCKCCFVSLLAMVAAKKPVREQDGEQRGQCSLDDTRAEWFVSGKTTGRQDKTVHEQGSHWASRTVGSQDGA